MHCSRLRYGATRPLYIDDTILDGRILPATRSDYFDSLKHTLKCATNHHVWQTQLKGRHTDHTIVDYTAAGNWQPFNYEPKDIFWGELGGLLEAIDGDTTRVVDHAHMAYTREHGEALSTLGRAAAHSPSTGWLLSHSHI